MYIVCRVVVVCGSNEGVYGLLSRYLTLATGRHALRFDPQQYKKCV